MGNDIVPFIHDKKVLHEHINEPSFIERMVCKLFKHDYTHLYSRSHYYAIHPTRGHVKIYKDLYICRRCERIFAGKVGRIKRENNKGPE
jgi:hypothetical protein